MKKKGKLLKSLAVLLLVMVCAVLNPKIAKAAGENYTPEKAKIVKVDGEKLYEKGKNEEHDTRYYKFTVPKDIGNKWINIYVINRYDSTIYPTLYNDKMQKLDDNDGWGAERDGSVVFHNAIDASAHSSDMVKLKAGSTYYLDVLSWDEKDFELCIKTVADDNWGSIEKAPEIKCNTWKKGLIEYDDDVDRYFVKLPKDKKEHAFIVNSDRDIRATFEDVNGVYKDHFGIGAYETNNEYREIGRGQRVYIKIDGSEYANYKIKVTSPTPKKTISILKVSKCKKGMKVVKGKTISKANVKVTVNGKAYKTVKSNAKGNFSVKTKKLKAGQKIKVTVSKSGYKTRTSGTIKVKKK